jgi:hypothetical protein
MSLLLHFGFDDTTFLIDHHSWMSPEIHPKESPFGH